MTLRIASIVEGHGEEKAMNRLLTRLSREIDPSKSLVPLTPYRVPKDRLLQPGELERHVALMSAKAGRNGAVFVLLDSDGDCPKELAPDLFRRASSATSLPVAFVLAHQEYEAWFLASAESLRGHCGLSNNLNAHAQPESVAGAKEWLRRHMPPTRKYTETIDQPALTSVFDLHAARERSPSFDKCWREVERLLEQTGEAEAT